MGTQVQALNTPRLGIHIGANFGTTTPNADIAWAEIIRPGGPPTPTVTSLSPTSAAQGQSLLVVVTGTNFALGATCDFGPGITVNTCSYNSPTRMNASISVSATEAAAGPRTVTVTNTDGESGSLVNAFTVTQPLFAPSLTSTSPNAANQGQSLNIVLTGSNFAFGATCNFGAGITVSSCTLNSSSQLTAAISVSASASAGARDITVTNSDGQFATLTSGFGVNVVVAAPPTLTTVSPTSAQQGQTLNVTLAGTNFVAGTTCNLGTGVSVNSCTYNSPAQMTANVSVAGTAGVGLRDVVVTNPDTQSGVLPGGFAVAAVTSGLIHKDFAYPNRTVLLAGGWSFLAKTATGVSRDTEQTGAAGVDYDQTAHPGTIRVPVNSADLYQTTNTSQNTLFLDLPSDWMSIRLKIAAFAPTADYQQVTLMAYQDDDNYVIVDRMMNGQPYMEYYREQGAVVPGGITFTPLTNTGNLILRLDKDAAPNTWKGYFSTDGGNTWVSVGTQVQALNTPRLGIHIGANFGTTTPNADVAWAEIVRPGGPPAPTITSLSPTSATQGQSLLVVVMTGTNFALGATCDFGAGITVSSCTLNSSSQLTAASCVGGFVVFLGGGWWFLVFFFYKRIVRDGPSARCPFARCRRLPVLAKGRRRVNTVPVASRVDRPLVTGARLSSCFHLWFH